MNADEALSKRVQHAFDDLLLVQSEVQCSALYGVGRQEFIQRCLDRCTRHLGAPSARAQEDTAGVSQDFGLDWAQARQRVQQVCLIGLAGRISCGKDTLADMLVQEHGYRKMAFADPLKDFCSRLYDVDRSWFDDRSTKERPLPDEPRWQQLRSPADPSQRPTPRQLAQVVGTECVRSICGDFWVRRAVVGMLQAQSQSPGVLKVVIPDARFENEARAVLEFGGRMLEIVRPDKALDAGAHNAYSKQHASEQGIGNVPRTVIDNSGTLQDLARHASQVHADTWATLLLRQLPEMPYREARTGRSFSFQPGR